MPVAMSRFRQHCLPFRPFFVSYSPFLVKTSQWIKRWTDVMAQKKIVLGRLVVASAARPVGKGIPRSLEARSNGRTTHRELTAPFLRSLRPLSRGCWPCRKPWDFGTVEKNTPAHHRPSFHPPVRSLTIFFSLQLIPPCSLGWVDGRGSQRDSGGDTITVQCPSCSRSYSAPLPPLHVSLRKE